MWQWRIWVYREHSHSICSYILSRIYSVTGNYNTLLSGWRDDKNYTLSWKTFLSHCETHMSLKAEHFLVCKWSLISCGFIASKWNKWDFVNSKLKKPFLYFVPSPHLSTHFKSLLFLLAPSFFQVESKSHHVNLGKRSLQGLFLWSVVVLHQPSTPAHQEADGEITTYQMFIIHTDGCFCFESCIPVWSHLIWVDANTCSLKA